MREKRNATIAWLERSNPLRGLSISAANGIFDAARGGDTQRLHWMYQEIECQNPVLSMAVTRRSGAAANFSWRVAERSAMDGTLSAEQKDAAERFLGDIENLTDLFEHLDLALFRGFAHAQPIWEDARTVRHIELLDSWKFLKKDGEWLFNPACDGFSSNCIPCKNARLITVERRRPVDVPALAIHLREAVGARDWGRFVERYALPKPAIVMSPNATDKDRNDYLTAASDLENGQVTVWPSGASLMDFAGGSRGVDPFSNFIEHQEKTILMLATGGTLGSMAESGAGTLAGNAQKDVWEQIVARDAGVIAAAVSRALVRPFLAAAFPGQPIAVEFSFDLTQKPTPKEIFETATAARNAGYLIVQEELEEATGFSLEKASETDATGLGSAGRLAPPAYTAFKTRENVFKNASRVLNAQGEGEPQPPSQIAKKRPSAQSALEALSKDSSEVAREISKLMENPSPEAAKALLDKLPSLLPEDPALAAVIAEAMAEAYAGAVDLTRSGGGAEVANSTDANGNEHGEAGSGKGGQFVSKGEGASSSPSEKAERKIRAVRSSPKADEQARACGYADVKDMMAKAENVTAERVSEIQEGFSGRCKAHEAIAVISENKPFKDAEGNDIRFNDDILEHYIQGRRRRDNMPKVENLEDLPYAIKAVKTDTYGVTRLNYPSGTTPDPMNPPRGTQREYHLPTDRGQMKVFVYIQGGAINGWHVEQ